MCTYNITLNDKLVEKVRPAFADDNAFKCWLQEHISAALELIASGEYDSTAKQQALVRDSLSKAFSELHSGQAKKDARHLLT